jgi:LacI family transcriptional regulator
MPSRRPREKSPKRPTRKTGAGDAPSKPVGKRAAVKTERRSQTLVPSGSDGKATINDIARLAGVSKKTVSRVINHSPLVRPDTREKVEELIRKHDYAPDPLARGLAFRKSFLIGMVYDNPNAQYIVNMQEGALDSLRGSGFELVVHPCDSKNADYAEGVRQFVLQQRLYGVILVPRVSEDQVLVDMLRDVGCRYARIGAIQLDDAHCMVTTNDREGAVEVAKYLESLGHRHIGLITGPNRYLSARERGGGFLETLARRGIKVPAKYVAEGGYTFESGAACAERLLSLTPRPTAIFALNDEMAAGVYKAAYRIGLRIPEDLSVVGFDDSPLATRLWPSLTTVRLPIRDMGLRAAALLLQPPNSATVPVEFTPHLVERESCRPPA